MKSTLQTAIRDWQSTLTAREKEIVSLHVDGLSRKQIATAACIAVNTVAVHLHLIRRKMQKHGLTFGHRIIASPDTRASAKKS